MADREQPYDPYIPASGGGANAQQPGNHRNDAIQAVCLLLISAVKTLVLTRLQEINGAIQEMDRNVRQLKAREERLDSLQNKTDNLAQSAQGFRRGANKVRKQMWWKDMKMRMCLIVGIIILLVIIIVPSGESLRVPNPCWPLTWPSRCNEEGLSAPCPLQRNIVYNNCRGGRSWKPHGEGTWPRFALYTTRDMGSYRTYD